MEAFEKWALQGRTKPKNPQVSIFHCWHDQEISEQAWREAFKTIRAKFNTMGGGQIISFIDWELEDEKR